ncbi:MAG: DciA family protein [Proteobacteria bacterium]|jgi:hypothetical protein|nr:DciA family protein [Pseudomonadota bacterium]
MGIPKSLSRPDQILRHSSVLKDLYARANVLLSVQDTVRRILDADVRVASCDEGSLHLVADSGAIATRLRYRQRAIITAIRQSSHLDINSLKITVQPIEPPPEPDVTVRTPPSAERARQIADTAKYIEDEQLRKALIRLARQGDQTG